MSPRLRVRRRAAAAVLLCAFGSFLAAPFVHVEEAEGRYCCRDRCCCAPDAAEGRTCFRSICRCGTPAGAPALVALGQAVLPPRVVTFRLEGRRAAPPPGVSLPAGPDLVPPDHPPPLS